MQQAPSLVGKVFSGRYAVERSLGWASQGQRFTARHRSFRLPPAHPRSLGDELQLLVVPRKLTHLEELHFRATLRAAARVDHPAVARILDAGICAEGWPFVVSERVEGPTLADELRRLAASAGDVLGVEQALAMLLRVASALQAAHERGVWHLALTPQHLHLLPSDAYGLRIVDLGLAQALGAQGRSSPRGHLDPAERRMSYTSPEQRAGDEVDHLADIYSFGVLAFEILSGRPAMIDREREAIAAGELRRSTTGPSRTRNIPAGVEALVLRCLESAKGRRVTSAEELTEALGRLLKRGWRDGDANTAAPFGGASLLPLGHGPAHLRIPAEPSAPTMIQEATRRSDILEELVQALRDRDLVDMELSMDLVALFASEDEVLRLEGELEQLGALVSQMERRSDQRAARLQRGRLLLEHEQQRLASASRERLPSLQQLLADRLEGRLEQLERFSGYVEERGLRQVRALQTQLASRQVRLLRRAGHAAEMREKLVVSLRSIKPRAIARDPTLHDLFEAAEV